MRSFALALAAAVANAGRVHPFFAENNYICELCKSVVDLAGKGEADKLEKLFEQFPKLQERINYWEDNPEVVDFAEPEQSCVNMQLCDEPEYFEVL